MHETFAGRGYKNADPEFAPQTSEKHGFYKLEKNGRFYFAKYSKNDATRKSSIATDIWWCGTIQTLRRERGLKIRTPEIIERGNDWYVARWIEGAPSMRPDDPAEKFGQFTDDYAACLAALDAVRPEWIPTPPPASDNSTPYDQLDRRWGRWAERPLAEGLLAPEQLAGAQQLIHDYRPHAMPQFQHGDFVPWHILIDANEDWWLIDGEHASTHKPRYYDLAYMYSRVFTRLHSHEGAAQLLANFERHAGISRDELYPAFLPVLTSRAIGMHFDAINDLYGGDYRGDAQDLLARCLSRDPALL